VSDAVNRVVVALLDRRRVRGFVYGFSHSSESFFLFPSEGADRSYAQQIEVGHCKAIYFVKCLEGNRDYQENKRDVPVGARARGNRRVVHVEFHDGELLAGLTESYSPTRNGFFMYPVDPKSNNQRIFVVNRHVKEVRTEGDASGQSTPGAEPGASKARVIRVPSAAAPLPPAPPPPDPAPPPAPAAPAAPGSGIAAGGAFSMERRLDAVCKVLGGRPLEEVAEDLLVPAPVLGFWVQEVRRAAEGALCGAASEVEEERTILRAQVQVLGERLAEAEARLRRRGAR
jgi:hypothetical protein